MKKSGDKNLVKRQRNVTKSKEQMKKDWGSQRTTMDRKLAK